MSVGKLKHKYATELKALEKEQVSSSHSSTPHPFHSTRHSFQSLTKFPCAQAKTLVPLTKKVPIPPSNRTSLNRLLFLNRKPLTIPQGPAVERAAAQAKIEQQLADLKVGNPGVAGVGAWF